ncbi:hypothetical protein BpOF4_06115 [Alkalihalophilus pseudofirmus OF4]|uniref:Lipoprotein n=1 Tax=Alkalihalophilus pseudofirmus (strain ATCC BAA-2126 / JCM 17055 / OF4) TaxID=398511 RepID=D3FZP3_ALKPO|nr:hypothetical protein [Alkalihalophilus pseudofirmus]ADC49285.1 hypothetical protein BpOF4_06115 [Alkalihalophilus pseudofirmus OF4]
MKLLFLLYIPSLFLLAGCDIASGEASDDYINVLYQEDRVPNEMIEEHIQFSAYKALDETSLIEYWKHFELEGAIPEIDFDTSAVVILGTFEPSTCPHYIEGFEQKDSNHTVAFQLMPYDNCSFDSNPMSFVLEMDRDVVERMNWVEFDREIVEVRRT